MTVRVVATAHVAADGAGSEREACADALGRIGARIPGAVASWCGLHLEGSLGAGDLCWDFALEDAAALTELRERLDRHGWPGVFDATDPADRRHLEALSQVEAWVVEPIERAVPHPDLVGIKRTNLVRVVDGAPPESVARWQGDCLGLVEHVPAIRNWSFGRVTALGPTPPRMRWTHAWEQEFETLEGLLEDYMASPYHWGWADAWYDPEMPQRIVDPDLAHLFARIPHSVLAWSDGR